eukprot:1157834-Pelagomonas_calceolata.AAC.4
MPISQHSVLEAACLTHLQQSPLKTQDFTLNISINISTIRETACPPEGDGSLTCSSRPGRHSASSSAASHSHCLPAPGACVRTVMSADRSDPQAHSTTLGVTPILVLGTVVMDLWMDLWYGSHTLYGVMDLWMDLWYGSQTQHHCACAWTWPMGTSHKWIPTATKK